LSVDRQAYYLAYLTHLGSLAFSSVAESPSWFFMKKRRNHPVAAAAKRKWRRHEEAHLKRNNSKTDKRTDMKEFSL
jgi:hypothetical protein